MSLAPSYYASVFFFLKNDRYMKCWNFFLKSITLAPIVVAFLACFCLDFRTNDVNFNFSSNACVANENVTAAVLHAQYGWLRSSHAYRKSCRFEFL